MYNPPYSHILQHSDATQTEKSLILTKKMVYALWNNQRLNFLENEYVGTKYVIYNNTEELAHKLNLEDTCSNDYIEREAPGYKESIPRNRRPSPNV